MQILVLANDDDFVELTSLSNEIIWQRADNLNDFLNNTTAAAFFNLMEDASEITYLNKTNPIFINSVIDTLTEKKHPANIIRFNGWKGFIDRRSWELSGQLNEHHQTVLNKLKIQPILVKDEPGFVSARVIAMIINEGYFAKLEKVSTENEIDIAMKLGTNYPKGPFEWTRQIGLNNILLLLIKLNKTDTRYSPCPLIELELKKQ